MSKSKLSNYKYQGAPASLSNSVKKVLDLDGRFIDASNVPKHSWTKSVQGAIATWLTIRVKKLFGYCILITDQVATAPCRTVSKPNVRWRDAPNGVTWQNCVFL